LRTRIHTLNDEATKARDPLEQQAKFDEMQQANNSLNALFEAQTVAKKELRYFRLIVQTAYLYMHQVETLSDAECNSLIASNPKEFNLSTTQQLVAKSSLLARKWKDKIEQFHEVKEKSLELVP
jgi:hypothetical protein